jgi:uncharacterized membrane protein
MLEEFVRRFEFLAAILAATVALLAAIDTPPKPINFLLRHLMCLAKVLIIHFTLNVAFSAKFAREVN